MTDVTPLTPSQAERFLAEVSFENRLYVSFIGRQGGFQPVPVYTTRELVRVAKDANALLSIDLLVEWLADVVGDADLAPTVRAAIDDEMPLFEQTRIAVGLVAQRLEEAEMLLAQVETTVAEA